MHFEKPESIEESWLTAFRELGKPDAILACTYTIDAGFFSELLWRFAEAVTESGSTDNCSFRDIPIDIVCDGSKYRGHKVGFNVSFWSKNARLFHAKLLMVLFREEVIWSDGSFNLTHHGWRHNREIAMLHRPCGLHVPKAIRELLKSLPQNAAAQYILESTTTAKADNLSGKCITSLRKTIGSQFLIQAPSVAEEVHLVAPFFDMDMRESYEDPLDEKWLNQLAMSYQSAQFHIYLPCITSDPLTVQGDRNIFLSIERKLARRIELHPVEPIPGPLHGKAVSIVYRPSRIQHAYMLVGSPNMTSAALLTPITRGNIETAWIIDKRWEDVKPFFRTIGSKKVFITEVKFDKPRIIATGAWTPLRKAKYDPLHRTLRLEWKRKEYIRNTIIQYAGHKIGLSGESEIKPFNLIDEICWLNTRERRGSKKTGFCPIEILLDELPACDSKAIERSPEDWLRLLGAMQGESLQKNGGHPCCIGAAETIPSTDFAWSNRVRDLSSRIRFLQNEFNDENLNTNEERWYRKLIEQIFTSHDPSDTKDENEKVWRVWVRLEFWRLALKLSEQSSSLLKRKYWRLTARKLRNKLGLQQLPHIVQKQYKMVLTAMEGSA